MNGPEISNTVNVNLLAPAMGRRFAERLEAASRRAKTAGVAMAAGWTPDGEASHDAFTKAAALFRETAEAC